MKERKSCAPGELCILNRVWSGTVYQVKASMIGSIDQVVDSGMIKRSMDVDMKLDRKGNLKHFPFKAFLGNGAPTSSPFEKLFKWETGIL